MTILLDLSLRLWLQQQLLPIIMSDKPKQQPNKHKKTQLDKCSSNHNDFKPIKSKHMLPQKIQTQVDHPHDTAIVGKPWSQIQVELREQILTSLARNNYKTMFPVQEAAIPLLLKNYDLAVEAQTGSGKTLAFLVPLLQKYLAFNDPLKPNEADQNVLQGSKIKYLLISPTRQLCQQSYNVLIRLLKTLPDKVRSEAFERYCHCVTGGSELQEDLNRIKEGVYVLVGTVGRLRELGQHMQPNWLKKVDYLFIDEADRVLKEKGIEEVIKSVQKLRRTAMFSATLQGMQQSNFDFFGMRNLAKITLKAIDNPTTKSNPSAGQKISGYVIPKSLNNTYLVMKDRLEKMHFLINFLQEKMGNSKIIVFLSTCASVDFYTKVLTSYFKDKHDIYGIHGKLKTRRRKRIIQQFFEKSHGVLFATDVVSRGIDFEHVHFIVQADPPEDPDNYIHRIGRTARVNRPGTAILMIEEHEEAFISYLGDKGVGVKRVQKETFCSSKTEIGLVDQRLYEIIGSDRDNVQKAKKAFVSYIRAYKEHDLRYIFEFKNIDIGQIANSFYLFRIPRVKEIIGKSITSFQQHQIDIESIPWLDKNQEAQFMAKQEHRDHLREQREAHAKAIVDIKNIKSRRKKVRRRNQEKEIKEMNRQHKAILKDKRGKAKTVDMDIEDDSDEDTQQLERKIAQKHKNIF